MKHRSKKHLTRLATLCLVVGLSGCANVEITPPIMQLAPPSARILQVDYSTAWSRTIGWFDAHEFEITEIDEGLGLIAGRLALPEDDAHIDCGTFDIRSPVSPPVMKKYAKLRVHLTQGFGASSQVLISVTAQYRLDVMNTYAGQRMTYTGPCVSRGGIEKQVFNFLDGNSKPQLKQLPKQWPNYRPN